MRGALHVLGTIVLVPYVALAAGFALLGHAIASDSLGGFLGTLLSQALWLVPWGLIGSIVAVALVAALGLSARLRWLGGLCLCLIAAGCLTVVLVVTTSRIGLPELIFLLPCMAVLFFGAWLAVVEWCAGR